jgi:hypothetical protein
LSYCYFCQSKKCGKCQCKCSFEHNNLVFWRTDMY